MSDPVTVVVWGDSIAAQGWPAHAETICNVALHTGTPVCFVNEAVGGKPAAAARGEFTERVLAHAPALVILHFGANDLRHDGTRGALPISTPEEFAGHMAALLHACRAHAGARVLVLGYHRVRNPLTLPTGVEYPVALRHYSDIARRAAEAAGADYLDLEHAIARVPDTAWTEAVCEDGVHLSPLGLKLYASIIATAVARIVRDMAGEAE